MNEELIGYFIGYGITFLVGIFITRAIFSIPKFLKLQQAQLQVLTEIAKQQGVKADVLHIIHYDLGLSARPKTNEEIRAQLEQEKKNSN
jgi:hypothetical protein